MRKTKGGHKLDYKIEYSESRTISSWGYVGYNFLWAGVPVIGQILWIIACFNKKNVNVRNYARSFACAFILGIAISVVLLIAFGVLLAMNIITPDMIPESGNEVIAQIVK